MIETGARTPHRGRAYALFGGGTLLAVTCLLLAGCGGGAGAAATARTSTTPRPGTAPGASRGGFGVGRPAAYGRIAALSGDTMQVQNSIDGQVAVTFGSTTTFTQTVAVAVSTLTPGRCVTAVSSSPASGTGAPGTDTTLFTATTITVSDPIDGSCTRAAPGGRAGGTAPSPRPSSRPRPSGRTGAPGTGARIRFTAGEITSASAGALTIDQPARGSQPAAEVTVRLDPSTRITTDHPATSAALVVGRCITATGTADSAGAVAATRIEISAPDANGCRSGLGGFGRGGRDGS